MYRHHIMISFLEGAVEHIGEKHAILNTGGIGYKVALIPKLLNILSKNHTKVNTAQPRTKGTFATAKAPFVRLYIHSQLNMRDGTFDMYGFDKKQDLDLFNLLTTVSGIGPKGAMNILSNVDPQHLKAAVINEDPNFLKKVSGLSGKIAQRLVIELKNKVDHLEGDMKDVDLSQEGQATEALLALGYSASQAKEVLKDVKSATLQERVRDALKLLSKK